MESNDQKGAAWKVRTVREERDADVKSLTAMVRAENWVDNFNEYDLVGDLDPSCWLVAESDAGEVIGHCLALRVPPGVGVGVYVVRQGWRGRGVGRCLWGALLQEVGGLPLVLGTADHNLPMYSNRGFLPLYKLAVMGGSLDKDAMATLDSCALPQSDVIITVATEGIAEKICHYDARVNVSSPRGDFLNKWVLVNETCHTVAAMDSAQNVIGFGAVHHASYQPKQWYVSPLYADSADVARRILHRLLEWVPDGENLIMFVADDSTNPHSLPLVEEVGLVEILSRRNIVATNAEEVKGSLLLDKVYAHSTTCMMGYV